MKATVCGVAALTLLALAMPASAQTLGELAQKEKERRKAAAKSSPAPPKVYTNQDLKGAPPPPPPAAGQPATDAKAAEPVKDATDSKGSKDPKSGEEAKDEAYWRTRMSNAREELRRNQMFVEALQTRINSLSADFAGRDDPYQRATIADNRQKAIAEMARVKSEIDRLTKEIADIDEEARRANVPAGWLR